MNISTT